MKNRTVRRLFFVVVGYGLLSMPLMAADCVWTGIEGDWDDPGAWTDCNGGVPGPADSALLASGRAIVSGSVTISSLHFSGGIIDGAGSDSTSLTVTDSLLLDGGEKSLARITLVNEGSGTWSAGAWRLRLPTGGATQATFVNADGATFEISGAQSMLTADSNEIRILNLGTLIKSGSGTADLFPGIVRIRNQGVIDVQQGVLRLPAGLSTLPHEGSFTVAGGATLAFDSTPHDFAPGASISGAGNVRMANFGVRTLQQGMTGYNLAGQTRVAFLAGQCPCQLVIDTSAETGSLRMDGGSGTSIRSGIGSNAGELTVNGLFAWEAGSVGQTVSGGSITLNLQGDLTLTTSFSIIHPRATINHHGAAVYSGGNFWFSSPSARFVNHAGASFEIQGERVIEMTGQPLGVFDNIGSLVKTGSGTADISSIIVENSGVIDVQTGQLRLNARTFSGPWPGARLVMNDGVVHTLQPLLFEGGELRGQGVVNGDASFDAGRLWPGYTLNEAVDGFYAAGVLEINGALTLAADTRTYALLVSSDPTPGTGYSQIQVNGSASLQGTLALRIDEAFLEDLSVGDEFVVMTCSGGCSGSFDAIDVSQEGFAFAVEYQSDQVIVRAAPDAIFHDRFSTSQF